MKSSYETPKKPRNVRCPFPSIASIQRPQRRLAVEIQPPPLGKCFILHPTTALNLPVLILNLSTFLVLPISPLKSRSIRLLNRLHNPPINLLPPLPPLPCPASSPRNLHNLPPLRNPNFSLHFQSPVHTCLYPCKFLEPF